MPMFTKDVLLFLSELEVNNNREWFQLQKERYKLNIETPFFEFITELIELLNKEGAAIKGNAKDCIFRIYRDVRFSKDKSPYKNHLSALLSKGGRKDFLNPGLYIELTADHLKIYSGLYEPSKDQLDKIINKIIKNLDTFQALYKAKKFKNTFNSILGSKAKRIDKKYNAYLEKEPLLLNKSFYYVNELESDIILTKKLNQKVVEAYRAATDMNEFLSIN